MSIAPVNFPLPSPIASALKTIRDANETVAKVAQDVAEHGAEGFAENAVALTTAEISAKAAIAVLRTAAELEQETLDILA